MSTTTTYSLTKPDKGDRDWATEINDNWDTVDSALTAMLAKDGTRVLSANWDAGAFEIRALTFESDVTTGTAPFTIASTTVSTNLNADLLDGIQGAAYLVAAGTTALTGNWDVGAFTLTGTQFISDIAIGTAPLVVTSTTVVTNLNADTVDAKHAAAFVLVDGTAALTASWDVGSYSITALTFISDQATGTAPLTVASTTKVTNLNADTVDGVEGDALKTIYAHICIDGGAAAITTGAKYAAAIRLPAGTIVDCTMVVDPSGSIVVDLWKDTYGNWPPTDADTITAAAVPTVTTATKSQDTTLTGWTTAISDGDIIVPNVDSCTTCTSCVLTLKINKT